jgi:hypothetical protein
MKNSEFKGPARAVYVADPVSISGQVDIAVFGTYVMLVEGIPFRTRAEKFLRDALSVSGVMSITSFIQVASN